MDEETIARIAHAALSAYAEAIGQEAFPAWEDAPQWMRQSSKDSVRFVLDHPDASASAQHDQWLAQKERDGWKYGPTKSEADRTHPMMVAYEDLPPSETRKDSLLNAIVRTLSGEAPD